MFLDYITLEFLYDSINAKLESLGITAGDYPIDVLKIVDRIDGLAVVMYPFETYKIGGFLLKHGAVATMCINEKRSAIGRNYDCAHELIHYWFHPHEARFSWSGNGGSGYEWQANEGAAQIIMPKDSFVRACHSFDFSLAQISKCFKVTQACAKIRIENFKKYGFL